MRYTLVLNVHTYNVETGEVKTKGKELYHKLDVPISDMRVAADELEDTVTKYYQNYDKHSLDVIRKLELRIIHSFTRAEERVFIYKSLLDNDTFVLADLIDEAVQCFHEEMLTFQYINEE